MAAVKQAEIIMNRESKFWDKIADRYSKSPVADEESYQRKLQVTREYLRPDMKVLEFGCGTGSTAITHAPFVNHIQAKGFSLCFRSHQMLIVLLRSRHGFRTVPGDVRELSDLEKLVSIAVRQAGGPVFGSN